MSGTVDLIRFDGSKVWHHHTEDSTVCGHRGPWTQADLELGVDGHVVQLRGVLVCALCRSIAGGPRSGGTFYGRTA